MTQNSYTWPTLRNRETWSRKTYRVSLAAYFQNDYSEVTKITNIFAKENLILFFFIFSCTDNRELTEFSSRNRVVTSIFQMPAKLKTSKDK